MLLLHRSGSLSWHGTGYERMDIGAGLTLLLLILCRCESMH
jgi:hypothetical protein